MLGIETLADLVDHVIPLRHREDLKHEWSNLMALCKHHHDVEKRRLECMAEEQGKVAELAEWVRDPARWIR